MNWGLKGGVFVLLVLLSFAANAQTKGLIIKPAGTGPNVLDPNGDGYSSQTNQGFINNDYEFDETEIDFVTLVRPDPPGDPIVGPSGMFNDIVGVDDGQHAVFTYIDGSGNFLVRFRMDGYAPNSKTYTLFIDSDQKFGFTGPDADPDATADNPGFELEISLHTNFWVDVYNIDNGGSIRLTSDTDCPYSSHCQKSIAYTENSGDPDFFYDFFVPLSITGLTTATPIRTVAVTTMNPNQAIGNNALSDVGGETTGDDLTQIFIDLIEEQTPTVPGEEVLDRTECPSITGPIDSEETTVEGTSEPGASIELFVNDVSVGTTTASGTNWTINVSALSYGDVLYATATLPGYGTSSYTCNITFVGSACTLTPAVTTIDNGDKGIRVTNTSEYTEGTVLTVYTADGEVWAASSPKTDNNPFTLTQTEIDAGSVDIGCDGQGNCMADGSYYITADDPNLCESARAYFCVGTTITPTATPVINSTAPYSNTVTGTGGISGALLFLYANGIEIATKTLDANDAWSVTVDRTLICNTTLTAQQIVSGSCISGVSTGVSVGQNTTAAPVISIDQCATSISEVTGYSGEADGTTINVYKNGSATPSASTTVSGNTWSVSLSGITGDYFYATATNSAECKGVSSNSATATLVGKTLLGIASFSIPGTVYENTSPVSISYENVSAASTLYLYISNAGISSYTEGDQIGSFAIGAGSGTANVSVASNSLFAGGSLYLSLKTGTACESDLFDLNKTVECQLPSFTGRVIGTPETDQCVLTSGEITITNSESLVIYTPVDGSGIPQGYSALGNGSEISMYTYPFATAGTTTFYVKAQKIASVGNCDSTSTESVTFETYSNPVIADDLTDETFCSGSSGALSVTWSGEGPYNIQWQMNNGGGFTNLSNGGIYSNAVVTGSSSANATLNISEVSGLDGYIYRCVITDTGVPSGCQTTTSSSSELTVILVSISSSTVTNATSGNNGAIDITASGGDGNYTYDWLDIPGTDNVEDRTNLSAGTYTVVVSDGNGCTYSESFVVAGEGSINLAFIEQTNISCYGADDGTFKVRASTGTPPYTFSINNFVTSQTDSVFSGLGPATYMVLAKDSEDKESNSVSVTITEPAEMVVYTTISNPSVSGNDGSIYATIVGGTTPLTYELYQESTPDVLITTISTSLRNYSFLNLQGGTFYLILTDDNGCTATKENIVLTDPIPSPYTCNYTASHSFNNTPNTYSAYDGSYNFFSTDWVESNDVSTAPIYSTGLIQIFNNSLAFGNCNSSDRKTDHAVTTRSISRQIDLLNATNIEFSYSYQCDQSVSQDNYTVTIKLNGTTVTSYTINSNNQYQTSTPETFSGLSYYTSSGNSTNTIEFELTGPNARSNFQIDDVTLTFDKTINTGIVTSPATCNNGKIDLSVSGGIPPYTYDWSTDGHSDFDDSEDLTGLASGDYTYYVSDSKGCTTDQGSVTISSAPLAVSLDITDDPTCAGGGINGSLTATVDQIGGGGPYTYDLYKSAAKIAYSISANTSKLFTGLGPGTYSVVVWQGDSVCTASSSTVDLTLPSVSSVISRTGAPTICNGSSTTVKVDITGGTSPYTVVLSSGQVVTNYISGSDITVSPTNTTTLTVSSVTDDASCISSSNMGDASITVNPRPSVVVSGGGTICSGQTTNVSFNFTGTGPWNVTYAINGVDQTPVNTSSDPYVFATGTAGTYTVTALTDANCTGSSFSGSAVVTVNSLPVVTIDSFDDPDCAAAPNGYINISVTGNGGYSYSWTDGASYSSTSEDISNLDAGNYTVTVTDVNTCQGSNSRSLSYDDDEDPYFLLSCPSDYNISTSGSGCEGSLDPAEPTALDDCGSVNLTWEMVEPTKGTSTGSSNITNHGFELGVTTITYTATDATGNTTECDFTVTVTDQTPPTALCINDTLYLDASGDATLSAGDIDDGSDDCSLFTLQISFDDVEYLDYLDFTCSDIGNTTVYLRATDSGDYADVCTATVTVYDTLQPTITTAQDTITEILYVNSDSTFTIPWPTISDNCSSDTVFTVASVATSPVDYTYSEGETWVYWSSTDGEGNSAQDSQLIVLASIGGISITCPDDDSLGCITSLPGTNPYSASHTQQSPWVFLSESDDWPGVASGDNCDSVHTVTYSASWQVHGKGAVKTLECEQLIYFRVDTIDPSISCRTDTTVNTNTNPCSYTVPDNRMDATAYSDNCAIDSIYNDFNNTNTLNGEEIPVGANTIRWIAVDSCGNRDTCSFVLTVRDIQAEVTLQSTDNDCPQLEPSLGFNPDNEPSQYDLGTTEVVFRVERLYSTANPWSFDFNVSGTSVTVEDASPAPSSGSDDNGTYSGLTADYIDITFQISNVEDTELDVSLNVTSISDNNNCEDTTTRSAQVTILAMPAVGPFD